jgi:hypothetical protein
MNRVGKKYISKVNKDFPFEVVYSTPEGNAHMIRYDKPYSYYTSVKDDVIEKHYIEVKPKFEVGKTYVGNSYKFTVLYATETTAFGKWDDGFEGTVPHVSIDHFEEVK